MYKISIVTPAFNCSNLINCLYNSICNQTYALWEWICIDDCSNDGTYELLCEISKSDNRVIVLKTEFNGGAAKARNLGIEKASGNFIAFLDADDLWKKNKLESQLNFMTSNDIDFSYTNYDVIKNKKNKVYSPKGTYATYKKILINNVIGCSTVMYNSSKIGKCFMPTDIPKREDQAAWLDILKKGVVAYKLDESLTIYTVSKKSVSYKKIRMLKYQYGVYRKHEHFNIIKSHFLLFCRCFTKIFCKY